MGNACGIVLNMGGVTVYHCGDTGLFSDTKLIGEIYAHLLRRDAMGGDVGGLIYSTISGEKSGASLLDFDLLHAQAARRLDRSREIVQRPGPGQRRAPGD